MSDHYTEADYHRALGITTTHQDEPRVHESIRTAPVGQRAAAMLDVTLGAVDATEAQRREAERLLAEADRHPWRAEWPRREVYSRRGEEAELAELYTARLGESVATAEAHVRRVLTAAWEEHREPLARLDAVAEALRAERARMGRVTAAETSSRTEHPSQGRHLTITERATARRTGR